MGIEGNPSEVKSLQASVQASRATGTAILLHLVGMGREKLETLAVLAEAILRLIDAGYVDRILLSHDVCNKIQLKRYVGMGSSWREFCLI